MTVAGLTIQLAARDAEIAISSPLFQTSDGPTLALDVRIEAPRPSKLPLAFDSGGVWRLHKSESLVEIETYVDDHLYRIARIATDFSRGELFVDPATYNGQPLEYPLDEVLF